MNSPLFSGKIFRERRGIALVSVLILVVLLTAVIIGFWATSTLEYTASRSYKASSSARLMADMAVNLVQSQINEATSQGMITAWASQPGAIRVYNNSGGLQEIYKLYSAQNLTTTSISNMDIGSAGGATATPAGTNDMPPTAWPTSPALWVDLNAPAADASGTAHFPIFNESLAITVDGFSIDTANTPGYATVQATQPAPMPVRWLYVLQNGQIIAPDTTSTATALTFQNAPVIPSILNPIVGRIAFWTDDETCKVNINTAGGDGVLDAAGTPANIAQATFWDIPRFSAPDDIHLANSQPASGEFQRYPGHPATVALHNVLYGLGWTNNTEYGATPSGWTAMPSTNFYSLLPRYSVGGSQGATVIVNNAAAGKAIPLKGSPQNHLYSSVAEMLFAPGANRPVSVLNGADSATQQKIETARFFLSAHSRAPEVTLFGQPRVSIWPEMDPNDTMTPKRPRTAIDQLLAFCATNSGNAYYFTRIDPTSCTVDISLARNVTLLKYLDYFTSSVNISGGPLNIPGYGGNFDTKYSQLGMRQILTEIFDYIRTINIADCNLPASLATTQTYSQPWVPDAVGYPYPNNPGGLFQVAPSVTIKGAPYNCPLGWNTQGIGIYPRLNEVAVQFIALGQGASPSASAIPLNPVYGGNPGVNPGLTGDANGPPALPAPQYSTTAGVGTIFGLGDQGSDPNNPNNPALSPAYIVQDNNQYLPSPPNPANTSNPNYKKWVPPGNGAATSQPTMAVQAFFLMSFVNPSQMIINNADPNDSYVFPAVWTQVSGLDQFTLTGQSASPGNALGFPHSNFLLFFGPQWIGGGNWGNFNFWNIFLKRTTTQGFSNWFYQFPFYSKIIPIQIAQTPNVPMLHFGGGKITITLYDGGGLGSAASTTNPPTSAGLKVVQTYQVTFPSGNFPMPTLAPIIPTPPPPATPSPVQNPFFQPPSSTVPQSVGINFAQPLTVPLDKTKLANNPGDRWISFPGTLDYLPNVYGTFTTWPNWAFILPGDVVQSMVLGDSSNPANPGPWTDARMLATANVPTAAFSTNPLWGKQPLAYNFMLGEEPYWSPLLSNQTSSYYPYPTFPTWGILNPYATYVNQDLIANVPSQGSVCIPSVSPTLSLGIPNLPGGIANTDWDNGLGCLPDGPWINKADEGSLNPAANAGYIPYFNFGAGEQTPVGAAFYSPNREVPSPGMFGSLPTGIDATGTGTPQPWQTLLFRPGPPSTSPVIGAQSPKDHLLLDLFWMPVAEPYAISEPFSSGGKVNLNYQIEPFTYITRSTAIRAVLNAEKIAVLSSTGTQPGYPTYKNANGIVYKGVFASQQISNPAHVRLALDVNQTLTQFDDKFNGVLLSGITSGTPDIFHSASQICEMYLVPQGSTLANFETQWYDGKTYGLVGDNTRERPYTNIYGQVTTKSNTFTVYYRVQSLKNAELATAAGQAQWNENQGTVLGEYRGSTILERYIDPNQTIPDFATNPGTNGTLDGDVTQNLPSYYRWRVVDNHQFAP